MKNSCRISPSSRPSPSADQRKHQRNHARRDSRQRFPRSQAEGNYAVNKHYRLPYVQVWNLDVQRTLPLGIVLNVGYNGSKGTRLDIVDAPAAPQPARSAASFTTTRTPWPSRTSMRCRTRSASACRTASPWARPTPIRTPSTTPPQSAATAELPPEIAQNWQNLLAEESNSSFDIRQKSAATSSMNCPSARNATPHQRKHLSTSSTASLSPAPSPSPPAHRSRRTMRPSISDVARGSTGSLAPTGCPAFRSPPAEVRSPIGSTRPPSPPRPNATEPLRATRFLARVRSRTMSLSPRPFASRETRTLELRATTDNVFNTVQYSGVDINPGLGHLRSGHFGRSDAPVHFSGADRY